MGANFRWRMHAPARLGGREQVHAGTQRTAPCAATGRFMEISRNLLDAKHIDLDIPLIDYGLDSVRAAELVVELEHTFGVAITDEEAATLLTARDVIEHVQLKQARSKQPS